ncbi:MAG: biotin/lipoyl-containing protein, partial [Planctomycetota bacterium]
MHIIRYPVEGRFASEGVIGRWLKKAGEPVKAGEALLRIEAAGELLEVSCAGDGVLLKILAAAGSYVRSGDPLAVTGKKGEDTSKAMAKLTEPKPAAAATPAPAKAKAKPTAKKKPATTTKTKKEGTMATQQSTGDSSNMIPILMPQAGQSMEEGTILSWKVKEGDTISVGQVIMEIETDKATMEVEATDAGTIARIEAGEGAVVAVNKPVAFIGGDGASAAAAPADESSAPAAAAQPAETPKPAAAPVAKPAAPTPTQQTTSTSKGEPVAVLMPQAGQSMEEGTILSWKVKEGDTISVGQVIMEIETDKATMEVEAVDAGRVAKIVAAEGDIVKIKEPVAYLAAEGVDVGGVGTSAEVQPAVAQTTAPAAEKPAAAAGSASSAAGPVPKDAQVHPVTKMRRAIAKNLLYSKQNVPHFYAKTTIDAGPLFATYRRTKEQFKCSVNDFVTAACAKAVRQYPAFRSQYRDTEIVENPAVNIGIAVGIDDGLTVPVVLGADQMTLENLAARSREVVESARNGKLEGM